MHVQLVVGGRVVQKLVEDDGYAREDYAQVVRPAPAGGRVDDEEAGDEGAEDCVCVSISCTLTSVPRWAYKGDLPAKGNDDKNTTVTIGPLCLFGTNSPSTIPKESWPAAASPFIRFATISVSIRWAVPPTMQPTRPRIEVPMTIHLRPKMSERRPTSRNLAGLTN